ncbi:MAG: SusF/SusE family outer membrane protein [Paludibacteraceae bacterium]
MKKIIFSLCALCASIGLMANGLPEQVVLVGDATEAGWSIEKGVFMHTVADGEYTWTGTLQKGELKFVAAGEFWVPSYGPVANGDSLHWADTTQVYSVVARPTFDDADNKFLADSGRYQLTLNLNTMQLTVADGTNAEDTKAYANRVYPIGTACTWGWTLENAQPMPQTGEETGIYTDTLTLTPGELKFLLQPSFGIGSHFGPDTANTPLDTAGVHRLLFHPDGDYKWNCTLSGSFVVTLNSIDSTLTLVQLDTVVEEPEVVYPEIIYPIGSACTWGWTIGEAEVMVRTADTTAVYSGTLTLQAGELKFLCQADWGKHFGPAEAGALLAEAGEYAVVLIEDGDNKWNCTLTGTFDITLNAVEGTLTLVAEDTPEDPEEGIREVTEQADCKKLFRNGQVVVLRGDKAYNMLGVALQ